MGGAWERGGEGRGGEERGGEGRRGGVGLAGFTKSGENRSRVVGRELWEEEGWPNWNGTGGVGRRRGYAGQGKPGIGDTRVPT